MESCESLPVSQLPPQNRTKSLIQRHTIGNPVRETGPPACMAKLIMMRHRVRYLPRLKVHRSTESLFRLTKQTPENEAPHSHANPHAPPATLPSERRIVLETSLGCGSGSVRESNTIDIISCQPCLESHFSPSPQPTFASAKGFSYHFTLIPLHCCGYILYHLSLV